jgi:hypothetical protein
MSNWWCRCSRSASWASAARRSPALATVRGYSDSNRVCSPSERRRRATTTASNTTMPTTTMIMTISRPVFTAAPPGNTDAPRQPWLCLLSTLRRLPQALGNQTTSRRVADALLQQVKCEWPEDRLLAHPQHPRQAPAGIPATGQKVRTPGCTFNGSPTGSSPSTASSTPRPPAAARRLDSRACGSFPAAELSRVGGPRWSAG